MRPTSIDATLRKLSLGGLEHQPIWPGKDISGIQIRDPKGATPFLNRIFRDEFSLGERDERKIPKRPHSSKVRYQLAKLLHIAGGVVVFEDDSDLTTYIWKREKKERRNEFPLAPHSDGDRGANLLFLSNQEGGVKNPTLVGDYHNLLEVIFQTSDQILAIIQGSSRKNDIPTEAATMRNLIFPAVEAVLENEKNRLPFYFTKELLKYAGVQNLRHKVWEVITGTDFGALKKSILTRLILRELELMPSVYKGTGNTGILFPEGDLNPQRQLAELLYPLLQERNAVLPLEWATLPAKSVAIIAQWQVWHGRFPDGTKNDSGRISVHPSYPDCAGRMFSFAL